MAAILHGDNVVELSTKSEIRNPKQIQMTKIQMTKTKNCVTNQFGAFVLNFDIHSSRFRIYSLS
jgi:hypothetical protein